MRPFPLETKTELHVNNNTLPPFMVNLASYFEWRRSLRSVNKSDKLEQDTQ